MIQEYEMEVYRIVMPGIYADYSAMGFFTVPI